MTEIVRMATPSDAEAMAAIYAPYVRETAISFEIEPPSPDEMRSRMASLTSRLPWLVLEQNGRILGYAYASPHHARLAYQWSVDVSVYVDAANHRRGAGRRLYSALFGILTLQGFYSVYAGITLPNPASVGLHERMGFKPVGVFRNAGFKTNAWRDVGWWGLTLRECTSPPEAAPHSIVELSEEQIDRCLGMNSV